MASAILSGGLGGGTGVGPLALPRAANAAPRQKRLVSRGDGALLPARRCVRADSLAEDAWPHAPCARPKSPPPCARLFIG